MILHKLARLVLTGRHRKNLLFGLGVAVASSAASADTTPRAWQVEHQKPVIEHRSHGDGGPMPPSSVGALWRMSELVVEGVLVGAEPADVTARLADGSTSTLVQTLYEFQIVSEIKPYSRVSGEGAVIRVLRVGGERDRGDHVERYVDEGFPPFEQDDRVLLFLKQAPNGDFYLPATEGGDSAFRIADGLVVALGMSKFSRSLDRRTRGEFLALLRTQKGGK